ncbi:MAG: hypothetical protein M1825_003490 [Sarcosagium campestre]|nr:MAG: hypothetical protein M1825_003490 [Sarcosagium campestre]
MDVEISQLTEDDIPGAIETIQEAFADDPYNRWIFDDQAKFSAARNRVSLGIRCRWGMRNGLFHVAKDRSVAGGRVVGTAMWLPPRATNAKTTWAAWADSWLLWFRQIGMNVVYGRGGLNVRRYWIWKQTQAAAQRELWTDPRGYYFCNIITVLPSVQGQGIGAKLCRAVTDEADRRGYRCYLESSRAVPNIAIYDRMGFRLLKEMECRDDGDDIDDENSVCKVS